MTGTVEARSDKFGNGSLKINGEWLSFAKDFSGDKPVTGDIVSLETKEVKWKGKVYTNVVAVKRQENVQKQSSPKVTTNTPLSGSSTGRDFDAENRGKVRHGLMVAALPLILQELVTEEKAKEVISRLTEYVMRGDNG